MMKKALLLIFFGSILGFNNHAQIQDSGSLHDYLDAVVAAIPDTDGTNEFVKPTTGQLTTWDDAITDILDGQYVTAHAKLGGLDYQLKEYTNTDDPDNGVHMIVEKTNGGSNWWGTYVFNTSPIRSRLIIEAPHPIHDTGSGETAIDAYTITEAFAFYVNGTARCNSSIETACSGFSSVCGNGTEKYKDSDPAHATLTAWDNTHRILSDLTTADFAQIHGFSKGSSDPHAILSNGTLAEAFPYRDNLSRLGAAIQEEDGAASYTIAHIDNNSRLAGTSNPQTGYSNGLLDPCEGGFPFNNNSETMHIETSKTRFRLDASVQHKIGNALARIYSDDVYYNPNGLVINELHMDPADPEGDANGDGSRDPSEDEFIEIVNNSTVAIDISGYKIYDGNPSLRHTFENNTILAPGQAVVVFGGGVPTGAFGGAIVQTASSGILGFTNSGENIQLRDNNDVIIGRHIFHDDESNVNQSLTRSPDIYGHLTRHSTAYGSGGTLFSPGTRADGTEFSAPEQFVTEVNVASSTASVDESVGTYDITVNITNPSAINDTYVHVFHAAGGDSLDFVNYDIPQKTIVFPAGSGASQVATFEFADDAMYEGDELFVFKISVDGGSKAIVGSGDLHTVTVIDNELEKTMFINELHADPNADNVLGDANGDGTRHATDDEFIELFNPTGDSIDISGWTLSDEKEVRHVVKQGTNIPSYSAYLVFGGAENIALSAADFGGTEVDTASTGDLGFTNTLDMAIVRNASNQVVAVQAYTMEANQNQSINLNPDLTGTSMEIHSLVSNSGGALWSPGTKADGSVFVAPSATEVEVASVFSNENENAGTVNIEISISNPDPFNKTTVELALTGGTTNVNDIDNYTTQQVVFPQGSSANQIVQVTITDDLLVESSETAIFTLQNIEGGYSAVVGLQNTHTLTIADNDVYPVAEFSADEVNPTEGDHVTFTDASTNAVSWSWSFPGGTPNASSDQNPVIQYNTAGTYNVTLTATNALGNDVETKMSYIVVESSVTAPVADFSADNTSIPVGGSVTFTDASIEAPDSWDWVFDGGTPSSSSDQNPVIQYNTAGTYDVTLTATNIAGNDAEVKADYITVTQTEVNFAISQTSIAEDVVTYQINATITDPSATNATQVSVVLTGGDVADIDNYTTQVLTFPAGSNVNQMAIVTITDDGLVEPSEVFNFQLQNISGGDGAIIGSSSTFDLTIEDNDAFQNVSLVINEIHADPDPNIAGDANGNGVRETYHDEFIEIVNTGGSPVDISGFKIEEDNATPNRVRHVFPNPTILPAGGAVVVFGGGTPVGNFGGSIVQTATDGSIGATNSNETFRVTDSFGNELVSYSYGAEGNGNQSLTRDPDLSGGAMVQHSGVVGSGGALYSPGTRIDGTAFGSTTEINLTSSGTTLGEAAGTFDVTVSITNASGASATTADLILSEGTAADINSYATQQVVFPAGSSANQDVQITITDDVLVEGNEVLTLSLSNVVGGHSAIIGSSGDFDLTITDNDVYPMADFSADEVNPTEGDNVTFTDTSTGVVSWSWSFPGGTPSVSSDQNPVIQYNTAGTYDVTLTAMNALGNDVETKVSYILVNPGQGGACSQQDSNDFESGWGIWNDGGSDARRSSNDAGYANSGSYPIRLRDNTSTSVMTTDNLDLSSYDHLEIDFSYITNSMDNSNEDFWLQISTDGGSNFNTIEEWNLNDEFVNGQRYDETAINIAGPFTNTTKIRFRCDASGNTDYVYIDDVVIRGCGNAGARILTAKGEQSIEDNSDSDNSITKAINLYPNPATNSFTIQMSEEAIGKKVNVSIFDIRGRLMQRHNINEVENVEIKFELGEEYHSGIYVVVTEFGGTKNKLRLMVK